MFALAFFGFVLPAVVFCVSALAVHAAFPHMMVALGRRLGATDAKRITPVGHVYIVMCLARTATFVLAGWVVLAQAAPGSVMVLLGMSRNTDFVLELVGCWAITVLLHELGTYYWIGAAPEWLLTAVFLFGISMAVTSFGMAMNFLAIIAAGDIARAPDYMAYAMRMVFSGQSPAGQTPAWAGFERRVAAYESMHVWGARAQNLAMLGLFVRAIRTRQLDLATHMVMTYKWWTYRKPERAVYMARPPPVQLGVMLGNRAILCVEDEPPQRSDIPNPPTADFDRRE